MAYDTTTEEKPAVTETKSYYVPTPAEAKCRARLYKNLSYMRTLKEKAMPHFQTGQNGPRSFNQYLEDSERIINGFTPSHAEQGKEDWRSNLMDNISLAKLRAIAAGVGLKVPEMEFEATNDEGVRSAKRADIFKHIILASYKQANQTLHSFKEVWHMMTHGVVFEYEGYKTGGANQEVIDSFDSVTGEIKTHREYRKMDGKPFSTIINPQEFFWWTFFVDDVQEQPRVAWEQHYTRAELEIEFSKFANYKYIKTKKQALAFPPMQGSLYFDKWKELVADDDDYHIIRMFSKADEGQEGYNGYEVWVNGVPMILCPLLWGEKEKVYPFAKQISAPFANTNFFVGMSLPGILEAYQEGKNTVLNTLIDKLYRSVDPMKIVGLANRDLLDVEADIVSSDNTVYVPDISQVKFLEHPSINQGELAMFNILERGIESASVDRSQQGLGGGKSKTARQAVIEDARAREIKGILYLFLEDLWYQKTKLRMEVILTSFLKDKAAQKSVKDRIISVKDYSFADGTRGTLDIYIAKSKRYRLSPTEIEAREQAMEKQGIAYKLISMDLDYLDEWQLDFTIQPKAFVVQEQAEEEDQLMAEIQKVTTLFPEFFIANKQKYLSEVLEVYGKHMDEYNPPAELPPPPDVKAAKVSESLNYKDAPPDIRRQIEKQAGLVPSQEKEVSPNAPEEPIKDTLLGLT